MEMISDRFVRVQSRLAVRDFVCGLLSTAERKTCWQLAELAGHARPSRLQRLLRETVWDEAGVGDDLRRFVIDTLSHPDAVLICDETGFLKKGTGSVAVQIDAFTFEIELFAGIVRARLANNAGYAAVQAIDGVGPILAAVFVAEIGDVHRFHAAPPLCSWAGLTPRHHESDTTVRRGRITKQGSTLVRWAAIEAVQRVRGGPVGTARAHIAARRGANIGKVAAARKLLTLVFYGLRDGHIRCLTPARTPA